MSAIQQMLMNQRASGQAGDTNPELITAHNGTVQIIGPSGACGFRMTNLGSPMVITSLGIKGTSVAQGRYGSNPLPQTLYICASLGFAVLASVAVDWGQLDQFYWGQLATPYTLSAYEGYYFVMDAVGYQPVYSGAMTVSYNTGHCSITDSIYGSVAGGFGSEGYGNHHNSGPINFKYHF